MPKAYRYILLLSVMVTAAIFIHEWIYDVPAKPYTWQQTAMEILVFGSICAGAFFAGGSGIYFGLNKLIKALR